MIVVPHFCAKDWQATVNNIRWWTELDGRSDLHCILSHDDETPPKAVAEVEALARQFFASVETFWYPAPQKKTWPAAPNHAWQNTARYMAHIKRGPWLWLESDCVAIRKGWLRDIAAEHYKIGKPFSGHFVDGMGHLNGCAVYPPIVAEYSTAAFLAEETAWDVVLGSDLSLREGGFMTYCHPAHTLFQHCWCINPETGKAWNGAGEVATFKNTRDVVRLVDLTMAIFHRCKDGSLIEMLRKHYAHPELAMVPQHTEQVGQVLPPPNPVAWKPEKELKVADVGKFKEAFNDPIDTAIDKLIEGFKDHEKGTKRPVEETEGASKKEPTPSEGPSHDGRNELVPPSSVPVKPFTGNCEILIVTYGLPTLRVSGQTVSDFDWLRWCLRCIRKHCKGFQGITVAIPNRDAELLKPIANEHAQSKCGIPFRVQMYHEKDRRGMVQHMAMIAGAEQLVPKSTTHVLHLDADVMFKEPVTPDEYFHGDKPVYVIRSWASLSSPDGKSVSDCVQWREPTDKQLGFESQVYGMCRHPTGFPIGFYQKYRDHIESVQGKAFMTYMVEGRNEFPQTRLDFTAMGAYAYAKMKPDFAWIDISEGNHLAPKDKSKTYWSHAGISPAIEAEISSFLQ